MKSSSVKLLAYRQSPISKQGGLRKIYGVVEGVYENFWHLRGGSTKNKRQYPKGGLRKKTGYENLGGVYEKKIEKRVGGGSTKKKAQNFRRYAPNLELLNFSLTFSGVVNQIDYFWAGYI